MNSCYYPYKVEVKSKANKRINHFIYVGCGKCPYCRKRHIKEWIFRIKQEYKCSISAHFVTLTYETKHLSITESGLKTLNKRDVQLYLKRLRKYNEYKIKYYMVGEYGNNGTRRPHYHLILFNVSGKLTDGKEYYNLQCKKIRDTWGKGFVHIDEVNDNTIAYTLKYMDKPYHVEFKNDDRVKPYSTKSNGLGENYIDLHKDIHQANPDQMYVIDDKGYRVPMPRYYRDRLFTEEQKEAQIEKARNSTDDKDAKLKRTYEKIYKKFDEELFESWIESRKKQGWKNLFHNYKSRK